MDGENCGLIDLELVRELCVAAASPHSPQEERRIVYVPKGFDEKTIPAIHELPLPDHIRQRLNLHERESFTRYMKSYKGPCSQIFATITATGAHFVGVVDYHESGSERKPNRTEHVADFAPKYSDEFAAWLAISGKQITQDQFLEHLRRWGYVITSHTDADMIEIASNLEFKSNGQFSSKVERVTGGRKLIFNEEVEGTTQSKATPVPVPDSMTMKSEIFAGGIEVEYGADLLYRVGSGSLKIIVDLKRPHKVIKEAIVSLVTDIAAETGIEPLIGTVTL